MAHGVVGREAFQAAQHAVVAVKRLQHFRRDRALPQRLGGDIVDLLHGDFHVHPQDVHLVGVPQDLAEHPGAAVQFRRQAVGAVPGHGGAQQFVPGRIVQVVAHPPFLKQHAGAHGGVVDGFGVVEGAVPAQLFKPTHVVQQPAQPGQIPFLRRQAQAGRDAVAQGGHPVGMVDLQFDFGVGGVIAGRVAGKGFPGAAAVDRHGGQPPFRWGTAAETAFFPIVARLSGSAKQGNAYPTKCTQFVYYGQKT